MNFSKLMTEFSELVDKMSNGNPVIAGVISLWLLGVATYLFRHIPLKIYEFLAKHLTTELTTTSQNEVFHNLLSWLEREGYSSKFRKIKLSNGRFGWNANKGATKSVGYGSHLVWFSGHPVLITLNKEETKSEYDKETISLRKLGRSHKIFDELISEIGEQQNDKSKTRVHKYKKGGWEFAGSQPKRAIESVFMEDDKKELLLRTLDDFLSSESWFIEHGIPYQLGILLHGPPGTGKTSIIKAIAAYLDRPLCIATLGMTDGLENMLMSSPDNSVVLLEDFDTSPATKKRKEAPRENELIAKTLDMEDSFSGYSRITLSEVLNAIDGVMVKHGRILVMTTNHPEKIDAALRRKGRVDLEIEVGYMTTKSFERMMRRFFDDIPEDYFEGFELADKLTGSAIQGDIRLGKGYKEISEIYAK